MAPELIYAEGGVINHRDYRVLAGRFLEGVV
jgi:hypothetical protein